MSTTINDNAWRTRRDQAWQTVQGLHWGTKLAVAAGFAGLTALAAQMAVPLPWTPVPLTFQVLAVFLAGTYLGRRWALVSILIYVLAGAVGLHVFAPSPPNTVAYNPDTLWSPDRWQILVPDFARTAGYTAGYIWGFVGATAFVGAYMHRRARHMDTRWTTAVTGLLLVLLCGIAASSFFLADGGTLASQSSGDAYDSSLDKVWLGGAFFLLVAPLSAWWILRWRRQGSEALDLYLVLLAAVAIIHIPGLIVLKYMFGWGWLKALALGSAVFLPVDLVKAAAAVGLSLPFLPSAPEGLPRQEATRD